MFGIEHRTSYAPRRQKGFLVPDVVPEALLAKHEAITTWNDWDPDQGRWPFDRHDYAGVDRV